MSNSFCVSRLVNCLRVLLSVEQFSFEEVDYKLSTVVLILLRV